MNKNSKTKYTLHTLHQAIKETYSDYHFPISDSLYNMTTKENVNQKDEEGKTPLDWAIYMNNSRIVNALLETGVDLTICKESPLIQAIKQENTKIVEKLITYKCNVNIKDKYGNTALYWAIKHDRIETSQEKEERQKTERKEGVSQLKDCIKFTRILLENGANSNLLGYEDTPPINTAVNVGNIDLVRLLLEYKADLSKVDKYGNSAYSIAVQDNRLDILQLLLDTDSPWLHKTDTALNDRTPLFYAVDNGNTNMVKILIEKGCDVKQKDRHGYNLYTNNPEIYKLINKK